MNTLVNRQIIRRKESFLCGILILCLWQIFAVKLEWRSISLPIPMAERANELLNNLSLAYISAYLFYVLSIRWPFKVRQATHLEAYKYRIDELEKKLKTHVGIVLGKSISFDCDSSHFEDFIQEIIDMPLDRHVNLCGFNGMEFGKITSYMAVKLIVDEIRKTCFETLCLYNEYLSLERVQALQQILDSNIYILLDCWDENIEKDEKIQMCNEIQYLYRLLLSAKKGVYY